MPISIVASAQAQRDYRCKIDRIATAEAPPNPTLEFYLKTRLGKEFTIERRTGIMAGALKNAYLTKPLVIDIGSEKNSFKVINSLRPEQGVGEGSNAYMLVVNEYTKSLQKPFLFAQNDIVYFGQCIHF